MDEEAKVVFRSAGDGEAAAIRALLDENGVRSEAAVCVPAGREAEALAIIEEHLAGIGVAAEAGAAPAGEAAATSCPNCEAADPAPREACYKCGFEVLLPLLREPALVSRHAADARAFCPECREVVIHASGNCGTCGEELEPLEPADRLCPELVHVLLRDTAGGWACPACRRAWLAA